MSSLETTPVGGIISALRSHPARRLTPGSSSRPPRPHRCWFGLLAAASLLTALQAQPFRPLDPYDDEDEESAEEARMPYDEKVARRACTMCRALVEPKLLTRKNWKEQILPRMAVRLGVAEPDYRSSPEGDLIRARKVDTDTLLVPVE